MTLPQKLEKFIRNVPDFPKPGIQFKDITPLLSNPDLCREAVEALALPWQKERIDAIAGIESRGFIFGMLLAQYLQVPFVPIRKAGKLPWTAHQETYHLEYGTATIEMHTDALAPGQRVLIHDDLLATGGTAEAAARLIRAGGADVAGYSFLIELEFLQGGEKLRAFGPIHSLIKY
jgi:adenine phosphoribosyltransferase